MPGCDFLSSASCVMEHCWKRRARAGDVGPTQRALRKEVGGQWRRVSSLCPVSSWLLGTRLLRRRKSWPDALSSELMTSWAARGDGNCHPTPWKSPVDGWWWWWGLPVLELSSGSSLLLIFIYFFLLSHNLHLVKCKTLEWTARWVSSYARARVVTTQIKI